MINEEDIVKAYEQAMNNAIIHGTGFVKIAMVDQQIQMSVVAPDDYRHIDQSPVKVPPLQFVEMTIEKEHLVGRPLIWAEWPNKENPDD